MEDSTNVIKPIEISNNNINNNSSNTIDQIKEIQPSSNNLKEEDHKMQNEEETVK